MKIETALLALALALPIFATPAPGVEMKRCIGSGDCLPVAHEKREVKMIKKRAPPTGCSGTDCGGPTGGVSGGGTRPIKREALLEGGGGGVMKRGFPTGCTGTDCDGPIGGLIGGGPIGGVRLTKREPPKGCSGTDCGGPTGGGGGGGLEGRGGGDGYEAAYEMVEESGDVMKLVVDHGL
ncbi:hypothetical protein BD410DRAFT_797759 [Rickenella mellea]|uniref:Uncharacterized protein n=1 Tax=Rickenella mellea TaxID=50990 RepID=A0A4R5XDE8_9AGAM|nr:hypothetical protein BD410DRAFT_797759 [Rickenella mellea]